VNAAIVGSVENVFTVILRVIMYANGPADFTCESNWGDIAVAGFASFRTEQVAVADDFICALRNFPDFAASGTTNFHG